MIHLADIHGKIWSFRERSIEEIYFDNTHSNNWVILKVGPAEIKVYRRDLNAILPHLTEDLPLKY